MLKKITKREKLTSLEFIQEWHLRDWGFLWPSLGFTMFPNYLDIFLIDFLWLLRIGLVSFCSESNISMCCRSNPQNGQGLASSSLDPKTPNQAKWVCVRVCVRVPEGESKIERVRLRESESVRDQEWESEKKNKEEQKPEVK